jgi:predicted metal-dependent phosphoesterase TrpH
MWVKGNLHCHSNNSPDGEVPVADLCQWYRARQYGLLAITDHNSVTDLTDIATPGQLALVPRSVEIGEQTENILAIGVAEMPPRGRTSQATIDEIRSRGGIAILAHPNWCWNHWTANDLVTLQGYAGIEVLNTHMRECEGHESAFHLFDEVLLRGKRIFAFGNDDAHNTHDEEIIGQAWNMVESESHGHADLRDAIRSGRLYVSTGGRITRAVMQGGRFIVECPVDSRIVFVVNGERVLCETGKGAQYELRHGEMYVRAEIESPEGRAYTQAAFPDD